MSTLHTSRSGSPFRLALDDEGLVVDLELIVGLQIGELGHPDFERRSLGVDAGLAEAHDRIGRRVR
ncbi:MAG: hypothetical protein AAF637_11140 [Pseudomonadota bacterium]